MPNAVSYFPLACSCHWRCKWTGLNFSICKFRFPWNTVRATLCFLTVNLLYSCLSLIYPGLGSTIFVMTSLPDGMLQDIQVLLGVLMAIQGLWGVMLCQLVCWFLHFKGVSCLHLQGLTVHGTHR
jgi:hypothetical protein